MRKSKRLLIRTVILTILLFLVGYTLYSNLFSDKNKGVREGDRATNFKLDTLEGNSVELSNLKGKLVLINFWGTWCKPCKDEMPAIQEVYNQYNKEGFEVLAINLGESDLVVKNFKQTTKVDIPILMDKDNVVTDLYDVYRLPSSFFINRDGEVVKIIEGQLEEEALKDWVSNNL
ncbi:thiol-disulfide oxidoreductase ResA [Cytobacillus firmus]|uniref:thiol-disulfide oxidoreductase ResA n=1 Tax=Cytobacillus firmus TaxID=1399 RepID=UPI00367392E7